MRNLDFYLESHSIATGVSRFQFPKYILVASCTCILGKVNENSSSVACGIF